MNFIGIDLHKKTVSLCVVNQEREILDRRRFYCSEPIGFWSAIAVISVVE